MLPRRLRAPIVIALVLGAGCSLVVPSELDEVRCTNEGAIGPPACDLGSVCAGRVCRACASSEVCADGFDNDCDQAVDEGCAQGGAGGSAGSGSDSGGVAGSLPDASTGGVGGVSGAGGGGVGGEGGVGGAGGVGGNAGTPSVGTPCTSDAGCLSEHFCATDPALVGVSASGVCTRGCCTSSECGAGNVCFVTPRGNNLCFPGTMVGRPAIGTKSAGSGCAGHGECRSGMCDGGFCVDACCTNGDCGGSLPHCTMRNIPGAAKQQFSCGKAGSLSFNQLCFGGSGDCQSNYCLGGEIRCTTRCCKQSNCSAAGADWECVYVDQPTYAGPVCGPAGGTGTKAMAAPCGGDAECQSGKCLNVTGAGNVCTDACCKDEDCGDTAQFGCRVVNAGGTGLLLCVTL